MNFTSIHDLNESVTLPDGQIGTVTKVCFTSPTNPTYTISVTIPAVDSVPASTHEITDPLNVPVTTSTGETGLIKSVVFSNGANPEYVIEVNVPQVEGIPSSTKEVESGLDG